MNFPLVSVVVPVYNTKQFLNKTVDSLLKQDYSNLEIILVDDGSTDESGQLCDRISATHPTIKTFHKENGGLSSARNFGINAATGKYIIFPDSDDWVETNYISYLVELQGKYSEALVCSGYCDIYKNFKMQYPSFKGTEIFSSDEAKSKLFDSGYFGGFAWNKLFDLELIRKNNLFYDLELKSCQDLHFTYRYLGFVKQVIFGSTPTYNYLRVGTGVMAQGITPRSMTALLAYDKVISMASQELPEVALKAKKALVFRAEGMVEAYYAQKIKDNIRISEIKNYMKKHSGALLSSRNVFSLKDKIFLRLLLISSRLYAFIRLCLNKIRSLKEKKENE